MSFIKSYKYIPIMLFRLSTGRSIKLRDRSVKRSGSFDILTDNGIVQPRALDPSTYSGPNGASMRPLGRDQELLVKNFEGRKVVVYAVPEGTPLPSDLILVHERGDHYSLQAAKQMSLDELNHKIDDFLRAHSETYTREQWLATFKHGGEYSNAAASSSSASGSHRGQSSETDWLWNSQYQRYYRIDHNGSTIWQDVATSSSSTAQQAQVGNNRWKWSATHQRYYRYDSAGNVEWSE
ncbi:hypothetical protein F5Y07DRAFT_400386 [Xylaria sp. FL0933]|nr:hypothetical protein F5Y07DRAFT_400386 [Xylaria sp. FL0933]